MTPPKRPRPEVLRVCPHVSRVHAERWRALRTSAGVSQREAEALARRLGGESAREALQCLSCAFSGEPRAWMEHSILENHVVALLERKDQVYCGRCCDFVYPVVAQGDDGRALLVRAKKKRPRVSLGALVALSAPRLLLRGLVNMGNTCFMNSVLQALAHNRMLQDYFFVARTHDTGICQQRRRLRATESVSSTSVCLGCELAAFMEMLLPSWNGGGRGEDHSSATPVVPHSILEAFWSVFPTFIGTDQHDAHEFLITLLGGLHSHTHPRVFVQDGLSPRFTPRGRSLCDCAVHQHFSGVLRSELECSECGTTSHKFDPFLDISLSLDAVMPKVESDTSPGCLTLDNLLDKFTADEELQDVNQVYCPRCAKYRDATKRLRVRTLPNVLAFHIRRFDFYKQRKISAFVEFPLAGLNLRKYVSTALAEASESSDPIKVGSVPITVFDSREDLYDLVAVINHHGDNVDGGHYTTFVVDGSSSRLGRSSQPKQWFLVDDAHVSSVSEDQVRESQAYILFYVRRRPNALQLMPM